ncbi:MAG: DUF2791 family P-loop domain-containing protein [Polyangiaceae bacterium]
MSDEFADHLVAEVTKGFQGRRGREFVPRQFLREFVSNLDMVDESDEYVPLEQYGFKPQELLPEEQHAISGEPLTAPDDGPELTPVEDSW